MGLTARAAAATAALVFVAAAAAGSPVFDGPTIKNPSVPPGFALRDQDGRVVRLRDERGKIVLLTFLYTHCPDVCPLAASNLNQAIRILGAQGRQIRVLAVSVDPKGDTPASVTRFTRVHHLLPEFRYLTGPAATLHQVWAAYGVKSLAQAGDRVDHTLYTLLLDRNLRARVMYDSTATTGAVAHDVRLLLVGPR